MVRRGGQAGPDAGARLGRPGLAEHAVAYVPPHVRGRSGRRRRTAPADQGRPLLWQSNLSMQAIALQCGFADAYHFSRRFRAIYGMAPTTFRVTAPEVAPPSPAESCGLTVLQPLVQDP
ncbi:AraC family transcriptional regulator [Nonomuraea sp. NPDC049784]|uniref:AraC family transcriptional regulator n=1 Tax=Nonomuraea sp. NPDC049784 TaxID=3154361 RepID=UPI0033E5721C